MTSQKLPETVLLEHGTIRELVGQITGADACSVMAQARHSRLTVWST